MTKRLLPNAAHVHLQHTAARDEERLAQLEERFRTMPVAPAILPGLWRPRAGQPASVSLEQWALAFAADPQDYLDAEPKRKPWRRQLESLGRILECERRADVETCGAILGDRAGSGKTDTVALLVMRDGQARVRRDATSRFGHMTLIVVPSHLLAQWRQRLRKWYPPHAMAVVVVRSGGSTAQTARRAIAELNLARVQQCVDVVLVTIDTLVAAAAPEDDAVRPFFNMVWYRLVVDEADMITNAESVRFEVVARLRASRRLFVSATPFRNARVAEMNAIFTFLGVAPHDLIRDEQDEERRHALLARHLVCSTGADESTMQAETRWITFDDDHERYVYSVWAAIRRSDPAQSLKLDTTLRKVCQSMAVLSKREDRPAVRAKYGPTCKIRAILRYERDELGADETALVFNQWVQPLEELAYWLERYKVRHVLFRRGMRPEEREALVQRIVALPLAERPRLVLISLHLASGIDGFQTVANVVLLFSPYWTPAPEIQARHRVDRPGQERPVRCIVWVLFDTIEEHVHATGQDKTRRLGAWGADGGARRLVSDEEDEEEEEDGEA